MIRPTPEDQAYFAECMRLILEEETRASLLDLIQDRPYCADGIIDDLTPDF